MLQVDIHQVGLIGAIAFGLLAETLKPLRKTAGVPLRRWLQNLGLALLNDMMMLWLGPLIYQLTRENLLAAHPGLLTSWNIGFAGALLSLFLLLELLAYGLHRLSHSNSWLWRLHAVHHSDVDFDVTTAERHHPAEVLISAVAILPVLLILQPDISVVIVYSLLHTVLNILTHANVSLGTTVQKYLGWLLVTPDFHRVHHSADRQYTNSNYGTVCALYDHLFGSARHWNAEQQRHEPIGLQYFRESRDSRLDRLLLMPWRAEFSRS